MPQLLPHLLPRNVVSIGDPAFSGNTTAVLFAIGIDNTPWLCYAECSYRRSISLFSFCLLTFLCHIFISFIYFKLYRVRLNFTGVGDSSV